MYYTIILCVRLDEKTFDETNSYQWIKFKLMLPNLAQSL